MSQSVTREELARHFHLPISEAARRIGICTTVIKKICRSYGINRWPQRKVAAITKRIAGLESEIKYATTSERKIEIFHQLAGLKSELTAITEGKPSFEPTTPSYPNVPMLNTSSTRKRKVADLDSDEMSIASRVSPRSMEEEDSDDIVGESPRDAMMVVKRETPLSSNTTQNGNPMSLNLLLDAIQWVEKDNDPMMSPKRQKLDNSEAKPQPQHQPQPQQFVSVPLYHQVPTAFEPSVRFIQAPSGDLTQTGFSSFTGFPYDRTRELSPRQGEAVYQPYPQYATFYSKDRKSVV